MDKVWVIEEGEYSDYHVVGIFSSEENAQLVWDKLRGTEEYTDLHAIECWPLDLSVKDIRQGRFPYAIHMLRDGTVESCRRLEVNDYNIGGSRFQIWKRSTAYAYRGQGIPDCLDAVVWAKTEQQAIKAANEHRAMMIASGEW